jgi:hypothetical protein
MKKFTKKLIITPSEIKTARLSISIEVKLRGMTKTYASKKIRFDKLSVAEVDQLMKIISK